MNTRYVVHFNTADKVYIERGPFNTIDAAIKAMRDEPQGVMRLMGVDYISTTAGCARRATLIWQGRRVPHWLGSHEQICGTCETYLAPGTTNEVVNLLGRVQPGESMPLGQCPGCGTLVYPEKVGRSA